VRERVGVLHPSLLGHRAHHRAYVFQMRRACLPERIVQIAGLQKHVDEGTSFEVIAVKPLVEDIEDRE